MDGFAPFLAQSECNICAEETGAGKTGACAARVMSTDQHDQLSAGDATLGLQTDLKRTKNRHFGTFWAVFRGFGRLDLHGRARIGWFRCPQHICRAPLQFNN